MASLLAWLLIGLAIVLVARRVDVRLVLFGTALLLGMLGGQPMKIVRVFFETFANERFVVPICTAMGFAYVMRHTGCDRHLVHLLIRPLTRVRPLLLPGTVVVGFLVNIPVVSQTSTAATLGPVVIPILQSAGYSPATIGAALLLGSSCGGELLNPGAPELRTVVEETAKAGKDRQPPPSSFEGRDCVRRILPLDLLGLAVTTLTFWAMSFRTERQSPDASENAPPPPEFQVNYLKAFIPVLPLALLFLTAPPLEVIEVPVRFLVDVKGPTPTPSEKGLFDSRLIGLAMLIGAAVGAAIVWHKALTVAGAFCEGAGYGFAHIISLIVAANCFGEGINQMGLHEFIARIDSGNLLVPVAGIASLAFATLCGSGMAATQSLFRFFAEPSLRLGIDPVLVGAVVSLASAAGRTLSPVSAVALMCGTLTKTTSFELSRRVVLPLLAAVVAIVIAAIVMASAGW